MFAQLQQIPYIEAILSALLMIAIGLPIYLMRSILLETTRPKVRIAMTAGMFVIYMLLIFVLALFFCSFASTVEECFLAWSMAFLAGCVMAVFQIGILYVCRPRRQLSEDARMKLKDI